MFKKLHSIYIKLDIQQHWLSFGLFFWYKEVMKIELT